LQDVTKSLSLIGEGFTFGGVKNKALPCMLKYNMESETFLLGMTKVKPSPNKNAKQKSQTKHKNKR